jgi:hypothetical protein
MANPRPEENSTQNVKNIVRRIGETTAEQIARVGETAAQAGREAVNSMPIWCTETLSRQSAWEPMRSTQH